MSKIPKFKNAEAAAEYWDNESIADHLEELKEVEIRVSKNLAHVLSVRVDRDDLHRLQEKADAQGVGITTMARMLLKKGLSQEDDDDGENASLAIAEWTALFGQDPSLNRELMGEYLQLLKELVAVIGQNKQLRERLEKRLASR